MIAAPLGMETWARTVRVPVFVDVQPPPDAWIEVCRAELPWPQVWYLTLTAGEIQFPVTIFARIRCGNGMTNWLEERSLDCLRSQTRVVDLWLPARTVEVDVIVRSGFEQTDLAVTGSLAPLLAPLKLP
jgi:hypothetical protein